MSWLCIFGHSWHYIKFDAVGKPTIRQCLNCKCEQAFYVAHDHNSIGDYWIRHEWK